ncbi:ABC multidrug transporter [Cordyceps militaris CM01]|uniref:ABC multidrug transporter n=1 Tax=Cordyceps militaris (strain CM01) TaxID=983644 RepID=G3JTA4_CORMM|nr:ABC multidrug transporter [Cordyceps militaris CM01]EGX88251.1 ABC multidrug transporter [Cordyceps militaris CM01]
MSTLAADRNFWDPLLDIFDFSLKFEQVILEIIPSIFGIILFLVFANRYRLEPVCIRTTSLLWIKLTLAAGLVALQAAAVGFHKHASTDQTDTAMPATSLELVATINVAIMVYVGHKHSVRSSSALALYLLFTFAVDITKSRSFFLRSGLDALGGIAVATACLRLCLVTLQEKSKRPLIIDDELRDMTGQEAASGFLSRTFLWFLNPIFLTGFYETVRRENMDKLGQELASRSLHSRLNEQWNRESIAQSRFRLLGACFWAWKWDILLLLWPRLLNIVLSFVQPFLIQQVTRIAELDERGEGHSVSPGERGGSQAGTLLLYVVLTLSRTSTAHRTNRLITKVRGGVVAQLMEKTHHLSERDAKKAAVLTHMSADVEELVRGLTTFIDIPLTAFEVAFGVFLLSRFIGTSCFFVLLPVLGTNVCSYLLSRVTGPAAANWNKSIEKRVTRTAEVLKQLPAVKMLGLGPTMRDQIHKLRIEEMETSKPFRFYMAIVNMLQQFADVGTPVVVIAAAFFWQGFGGKMSASQVFPTLAVVSLIQAPTARALSAYTDVASMTACFGRIQKFLLLEERKDSRVKWDPSASLQEYEPLPTHYGSEVMRPRQPTHSPRGIIQFANASIRPVEMEESLLSEITVTLGRGSVAAVVGPTGCGKSTFFRSILGETKTDSGYVYTDKVNIAYCGPNVWLKDVSIRDNIIGCLEFDAERYADAIETCQLGDDLARLPGGDAYVVGPNGLMLSGGQRQRVSLARAVFASCDITIIDDSFSSLDRTTATDVLFKLCGPEGALRRSGSTVLLSTYLPEVLDIVDSMITIDEEGLVTLDQAGHCSPDRLGKIQGYLSSARPCVSEETETKEKALISRSWPTDPKNSVKSEDDPRKKKGNLGLYVIFIDSIGRLKCFGISLLAFLLAVSELIPEIYLRIWTDLGPTQGLYFIGYSMSAVFACFLVALTYWLLYTILAVRAAVALHEQILDVAMRSTIGYLTSTKTGDLLNRFSQDANLIARILPFYLFRTVYMFFATLITVGIILSSATYMTAALPAIVVAVVLTQGFYLRTSRQIRHLDLEEKAPLYTFFTETADGLLHIQAFGWREQNLANGYHLLDNSQQPYYLMLCIQQWLGLVLGLISACVAFTLVSIVVWVKHGTSGSAVGLSFLSIMNFQRLVTYLLEAWIGSETSVAALSRLESFRKDTPRENRPAEPVELPRGWPFSGAVDFTGVSARYRPADDVPPIIRDFSVAIDARDKVGIIGRTGSGKSSILLTLLGFMYYSGTVEIDDVDIANVDADVLRSHIITITQDPVQFSDTVRKNLLPFTINEGEIGDGEKRAQRDTQLTEVLTSLGLWDQLVQKGGLDAMLPDVGYSKGEMQLFAIARAIIRRRETGSNLVLIDEATSNLDALRESQAQQALNKEFRDCTILTVAHRQETIEGVDFMIVMNDGRMENLLTPQTAPRLFGVRSP